MANERVSNERLAEMLRYLSETSKRAATGHGMNLREQEMVSALFELQALRSTHQGEVAPVAWLHPEAGWAHERREQVAMHCRRDGPDPIPLYLQPSVPKAGEVTDEMVERACISFIDHWQKCTDEVKADCRQDMRSAILAALDPK